MARLHKDLRTIVKALKAQGFEIARSKGDHFPVLKNGVRIAVFSGSPSDPRSYKNTLADLRRAGFEWVH